MTKRSYMVIYERMAEDNWGGWAVDIGGAVGAGDSLEAVRKTLREGIEIQLQDFFQRGLPIPAAAARGFDFSEFDTDPEQSHYEIEWVTVELPNLHDTLQHAA